MGLLRVTLDHSQSNTNFSPEFKEQILWNGINDSARQYMLHRFAIHMCLLADHNKTTSITKL